MELLHELSFFKRKQKDEERYKEALVKNGSLLLDKLIVSFHGRHKVPIRSFTATDLIRATNDFTYQNLIFGRDTAAVFKGSFEERLIIVKKSTYGYDSDIINDIVITSQMSTHKNVLKLLGCCLEFEDPALVFEHPPGIQILSFLLYNQKDDDRTRIWRNRIRIANDIANAILYLHTAFPKSYVHRNLSLDNIIVDQDGVAKLFDFSVAISLPPGELLVEDDKVVGAWIFIDPNYINSGCVSQKSDVYSFGVLLLVLLNRQRLWCRDDEGNVTSIVNYVKRCESKEGFNFFYEDGGVEQQQQMKAFLVLALKCVQMAGDDRPEMIEVAREVRRIERSARHAPL